MNPSSVLAWALLASAAFVK
ncbi:hypothetical protein LL912_13540 [Niabella sp. CC-SYL272]|nr:hypothetical protein [Niabella agricola]